MAPLGSSNQSSKQPDGSSINPDLSKGEPESSSIEPQQKNNEATVSADKSLVWIDTRAKKCVVSKPIFGTDSPESNQVLIEQVSSIAGKSHGEDHLLAFKSAMATIDGIGVKDTLEGLLAVQMMGIHNLTMECLKHATLENQTAAVIDANINRVTKLSRTFTAQMEALNRHRGTIIQQMVVENVNVNGGGRTIVGPVNQDNRGSPKNDG